MYKLYIGDSLSCSSSTKEDVYSYREYCQKRTNKKHVIYILGPNGATLWKGHGLSTE